ncbi:Pantoate-beta-alanine ligase [Cylindrobasidium torrendii FP15055 ss-10]|uniref:Pantoate--beta-alanine ligase n=1 Tax=Cylindrobasidium torrendii FP15055 ss-10 TaxID=1314674 RepID=A0A0D7BKE0_9AGAR|nr:Pantoate-beta-alanine ligase [Cylindrobasidium torrendii FP15055 ss-10]
MSTLRQFEIPCYNTVASYREWRQKARDERKSVGFVATMGALHSGHLSLVRQSLRDNDLTVLSIFVNPAQFAPHEDLATYPRTLERDLNLASQESFTSADGTLRKLSAAFVPTVSEMYPTGIVQDVALQKGTFVEVKGYGDEMEGKSRPTFFRGVATVVTKLFNIIEPTQTYFGQKDIQQALLLRRMVRDTLLSHPTPENLHIVPTARDEVDGLALSSRNAYLSPAGRRVAPTLYAALQIAKTAWEEGCTKQECVRRAIHHVEQKRDEAAPDVVVKADYIELNNSDTFEVIPDDAVAAKDGVAKPVLLSGAMWVDKTRLIDNIILGNEDDILG